MLTRLFRTVFTRLVIINMLVLTSIAAAFGYAAGHVVIWLTGGALVGLLLALAVEVIFRRFKDRPSLFRRRMLLLVLVESLLAVFIFTPAYAAYTSVYPTRFPVSVTPADLSLAYEEVTLTTGDGVTLRGWYIPSHNRAAVIAIHAFNGNRTGVLYHAQALAEHGYGVLMFDLRTMGESGGDRFGASYDVNQDVMAAVAYLQRRSDVDANRIGALGLSIGAMAIANAAADSPDLAALWMDGLGVNSADDYDSVPPDIFPFGWAMRPLTQTYFTLVSLMSGIPSVPPMRAQIARIAPRPMVIVTGSDGLEQFFGEEFYAVAGPNAILWELPDTNHISGMMTHPDEYRKRMMDFFDASLQ
jgi:pimeloyl-ACP methyl ester carboxylesterase